MKICTICKRQYADSLTFCLDDGTVLTAAADANPTLVDPAATWRLEARETLAPPAVKRSAPLIWIAVAAAAIILVISVAGVAGLWLIGSSNSSQTNNSSAPAAKPTPISTLSASEEVVQANNSVGAALVTGDTDALSRLLADDYRYVSDDGVTLNKAEVLMLMRTGNLSYEYLNTTDPTVDVDSGSAKADLSARATAKGQLRREPFTDSYFYRNTYEKRGGRWQLVSGTVWHRQ